MREYTLSALYVDDEGDLLEIGKKFLEQSGIINVDTVKSAREALEKLSNRLYDAIISDYEMPGMDGIGLLKEVRRKYGSIPFILFTGRGREEVVIQAINEGADFYLQKGGEPTAQFAELSNKIQYAVARNRAETTLLRKNEELRSAYEDIAAKEEILRSNFDELSSLNSASVREYAIL